MDVTVATSRAHLQRASRLLREQADKRWTMDVLSTFALLNDRHVLQAVDRKLRGIAIMVVDPPECEVATMSLAAKQSPHEMGEVYAALVSSIVSMAQELECDSISAHVSPIMSHIRVLQELQFLPVCSVLTPGAGVFIRVRREFTEEHTGACVIERIIHGECRVLR